MTTYVQPCPLCEFLMEASAHDGGTCERCGFEIAGPAARSSDGDDVHPQELVRGVASFLRNPVSYRAIRSLVPDRNSAQYEEALTEIALERARNIVSWIVAEFEVTRREL